MEANAAQHVLEKEEAKLREPEIDEDSQTKVLLTWFQARNDLSSNVGNKGIIEDISKKPLNIIIDDDSIKDRMLHQENPFTTVFIVDVKLMHARGRLIAYKVINLHGTIEAEERA